MFPIRDENPTLRTAIVTLGLILANVSVWVLVQGMGSGPALVESAHTTIYVSTGWRLMIDAYNNAVLEGE